MLGQKDRIENGMENYKKDGLKQLRDGEKLSFGEEIALILKLSFPAILAQISSTIMQYIDASMVGRLGPTASASIGLVSSSTWLIGGIISAAGMGFTIRVAHKIGAKEDQIARNIVKWGLLCSFLFSLIVTVISVILSFYLPELMGGEEAIRKNASLYFLIYSLTIPVQELLIVSQGMLQSSGNIRLPSMLNVIMCGLDVLFNYLLIPRLEVAGAALGTTIAKIIITGIMLYYLLVKSESLSLFGRKDNYNMNFRRFIKMEIPKAMQIAIPIAADSAIMGFAYVAFTKIVSPFGTASIAANSFAITAESLCYMPGYGIGVAASTVVGQCIGAKRNELGKRLGWIAVILGILIMGSSGFLMYIFAPQMIGILTPDREIRELGVKILRIEAFAEPLYGASIVSAGVFRGAGETFMSSVLNLVSVWVVRIPLAILLGSRFGLVGAWIAMCTELCVRGTLFLIRLALWNRKHF